MTGRDKTRRKAGRAGLPEVFHRPVISLFPTAHQSQPPSPAGSNRAMRRLQAKQARRKLL
jgi:hypothetical protein